MELHPNLLQIGYSQIPIQMENEGFIITEQIGNVFTWTRD